LHDTFSNQPVVTFHSFVVKQIQAILPYVSAKTFGPGEVFGEMSLPNHSQCTVKAKETAEPNNFHHTYHYHLQ
jgi:hypothetical protein